MGLVTSRLNFESLHAGGQRSQPEEVFFSYSMNKNYFSNYFLMGGERYDVNDPDYLFGDNCDLNFLSCTKPYPLPYKKAQQSLLANLKHNKSSNKVSSRVSRLNLPFNILTNNNEQNHHRHTTYFRKQDAQQTQVSNNKGASPNSEPSQPLVMFVNIRKETLRLVKSSLTSNLPDSDLNSLNNSVSISTTKNGCYKLVRKTSTDRNRYSGNGSSCSRATAHVLECLDNESSSPKPRRSIRCESEISSLVSATSSTKSGYTSLKGEEVPVSSYPVSKSEIDDEDDEYKDALNDTSDPLVYKDDGDDDNRSDIVRESLLSEEAKSTKENRDIRIKIESVSSNGSSMNDFNNSDQTTHSCSSKPKQTKSKKREIGSIDSLDNTCDIADNRVYNIEFYFDTEVDCSIRIFYFCTRESNSTGITYKPQHATYKSKVYYYKKGLNQKFDQPEHTFQPYLFDEDLLIYKPLDIDGNYNSGSVFPIVIHCVALEGQMPRQSHSLIATIEKSQLDSSYSIKPLKQLIFADGVQYILQDIYGIEHKQFFTKSTPDKHKKADRKTSRQTKQPGSSRKCDITDGSNLDHKSQSLQSNLNMSNISTGDTASVSGLSLNSIRPNRGSLTSIQLRSLGSETTSECVICISEERDTMLLPCRHLCLCTSCAQSLRFQSSSCPICRCPFRAALNLRPTQRPNRSKSPTNKPQVSTSNPVVFVNAEDKILGQLNGEPFDRDGGLEMRSLTAHHIKTVSTPTSS